MGLRDGWNHLVRGWRVVKATTTPTTNPHPKPKPQPVTDEAQKPIVTASRETARSQKADLKFTVAPKRASEKSKKAAEIDKTASSHKATPALWSPHKVQSTH